MIKHLAKRERIILYATIAIIAFSLVFSLFISPVLKENETLNKEIALAKMKLKKYLQLLSEKNALQQRYNKFFAHLGTAEEDQKTPLDILSELEKLAKASGVRILDIRPQGAAGSDLHKGAAIDLRAEGVFEEYIRFIYAVESSPLFLRVRRLQLTAKPESSALEGAFSIIQLSSM